MQLTRRSLFSALPTLVVPALAAKGLELPADGGRDKIVKVSFVGYDEKPVWSIPGGISWVAPEGTWCTKLTAQFVDNRGNPGPPEWGGVETTVQSYLGAGRKLAHDVINGWEFNPDRSPHTTVRFRVYREFREGFTQLLRPGHMDVVFGKAPSRPSK